MKQNEVIPVDTHVHQIAVKHYHLPGLSGSKGKGTMTPKLYNEISDRLGGIWGKYAGWAHSVRVAYDTVSEEMLNDTVDLVHVRSQNVLDIWSG